MRQNPDRWYTALLAHEETLAEPVRLEDEPTSLGVPVPMPPAEETTVTVLDEESTGGVSLRSAKLSEHGMRRARALYAQKRVALSESRAQRIAAAAACVGVSRPPPGPRDPRGGAPVRARSVGR